MGRIMKKIRTAIIGMGRMGKTRYEAMTKHGGYEIIALCDTCEENLKGCVEPCFRDWKDCIDSSKPEAVIVCTYNSVIPDVVCYALDRGMAVFSEKPPGRNLADTLRMKEAFERAELRAEQEMPRPGTGRPVLKFGLNHRYHNSVIEARALLDSGILGDLVCARGVYGKAGSLHFNEEWRNNKDISGGGIMLDQGIHMLDLMYYFMGEFTDIKSTVDQLVWKDMPTEDSAFSILKTKDGRTASLHSSAIQWRHKFSLDLICTRGFISLNGLLTSTMSYGEERISYYFKDLERKTGGLGKPEEHTLCFHSDESWSYEMQEFYDAAAGGREIRQGTIDQAVSLMRMIEGIYHTGV